MFFSATATNCTVFLLFLLLIPAFTDSPHQPTAQLPTPSVQWTSNDLYLVMYVSRMSDLWGWQLGWCSVSGRRADSMGVPPCDTDPGGRLRVRHRSVRRKGQPPLYQRGSRHRHLGRAQGWTRRGQTHVSNIISITLDSTVTCFNNDVAYYLKTMSWNTLSPLINFCLLVSVNINRLGWWLSGSVAFEYLSSWESQVRV